MSRPRRLAWSFLWVRKCSVSPVMRSVRSAICTSGDPVSLGSRRYESMISVLRSLVIAIAVLITSAADDITALNPVSLTLAVLRTAARVGERAPSVCGEKGAELGSHDPGRMTFGVAKLNPGP